MMDAGALKIRFGKQVTPSCISHRSWREREERILIQPPIQWDNVDTVLLGQGPMLRLQAYLCDLFIARATEM